MKRYINKGFGIILFCFSITFLSGCFAVKDTSFSRKVQNLTARYNYIYNSNVLLTKYNEELLNSYVNNYEKILPVYLDPAPQINVVLQPGLANKDLDEIIHKGQTIINEKSFSNYIDDAYMLLGKAQYLKGNYFTASEYFDYVAKTYKSDLKVYVMALNWKARSQMILNNMDYANKLIDTMLRAADHLKVDLPEPLATTAQMRIYQNRNSEAITLLLTAIRKADEKQLRIRWMFILAQLQEKQNDLQNAYINFNKVENSNAPFEMYFHANLNRIKIRSLISGYKLDEEKQLLALIKDDKNADYIDQIYYQIGEMFSKEGNFKKAEDYYLKSVKETGKNQNQKALSYLRIADLNFKNFGNYIKAKAYYDSTVVILPVNFPDYEAIVKKANNLKYLTDRYTVISNEDTLQRIALLPVPLHEVNIKAWLKPAVVAQNVNLNTDGKAQIPVSLFPDQNTGFNQTTTDRNSSSLFYFNNSAAVSTGFGDFKKRWGNRKLEDNWRQSIRSSAQESNQILNGGKVAVTDINLANDTSKNKVTLQEELEKKFLGALPVNPELLKASNQKIIDAYFEIAGFYQQELNDKTEANKVYEILLSRFPDNNHLDAIYYSLYLNYKDIDQNRSAEYRQMVITKFPNSNFTKVLIDPNYSVRQSQLENQINTNYNAVYDVFAGKNYPEVINSVSETINNFPDNNLAPQYAYLKAISVGRTQKVDALLTQFNSIVGLYPEDKIITPLVKSHLEYIQTNLAEFKQRKVALYDFDPNAQRFMDNAKIEPIRTETAKKITPVVSENKTETAKKPEIKPEEKTVKKLDEKTGLTTVNGIKTDGTFTNATSETYYYVIDVRDATLTLSSSRFGIGQFNRGNFPENDLVHKLIEFDNDQLIYINSFVDLEDATLYEKSIAPQLKNIMKVPANIYKGFIISKENFEKLTDRKRIDQYLEFYKNSY